MPRKGSTCPGYLNYFDRGNLPLFPGHNQPGMADMVLGFNATLQDVSCVGKAIGERISYAQVFLRLFIGPSLVYVLTRLH